MKFIRSCLHQVTSRYSGIGRSPVYIGIDPFFNGLIRLGRGKPSNPKSVQELIYARNDQPIIQSQACHQKLRAILN
jgi:hypothetical protein